MNPEKKDKPAEEALPGEETLWERWIEDWKRRPRFYVAWLVGLGLLATVGIIYWQQRQTQQEEELNAFNQELSKVYEEEDADGRVARIEALADKAEGYPWEPRYWLTRAMICRSAGDNARTHEEKVRFYREAIEAVDELKKRFPKSPLVLLPWKPTDPGTEPKPSVAEALREYCEKQLAFLEKHPYDPGDTPDKGLSAAIQLTDAEGAAHELKLRFYSKLAPQSVDTFLRLAKEGWFKETLLFGIEREKLSRGADQEGTDKLISFHLGSGMTKAAPEDPSLWGDMQKDRVGFTLRGEKNGLAYERGKVALEWYQDALGSSPVRLVVFTDKPDYPTVMQRAVFAEVVDGDELLDQIMAAETDMENPVNIGFTLKLERIKKPWKITGITVSGKAEEKPDDPITDTPRLPEPPKKDQGKDPSKDEEKDSGSSDK